MELLAEAPQELKKWKNAWIRVSGWGQEMRLKWAWAPRAVRVEADLTLSLRPAELWSVSDSFHKGRAKPWAKFEETGGQELALIYFSHLSAPLPYKIFGKHFSILIAPKPSLLICSWNHCGLAFIHTLQPYFFFSRSSLDSTVAQPNEHTQFSSLQCFPRCSPSFPSVCFYSSSRLLILLVNFLPHHLLLLILSQFWFVASHLTLWHWSDSGGWSWDLFYLYSFPWWLNPGSWLHMPFICWWFPNLCLQHEPFSELSF